MYLDFYVIVAVAVVLFCLFEGYFGKSLQKLMGFLSSPVVLEYLVIVLLICICLYIYIDNIPVLHVMSPSGEGDIPKINLEGTSVNVNNPNINVSTDGLVRGLTNVGVGAAIAGGMSATSSFVKTASLPPAVKFGTIVAGGAAAGVLVTATNAANSITQAKIKSYGSNSGSNSGVGGNNTAGGQSGISGSSTSPGNTGSGSSSAMTGGNNYTADTSGMEDCAAFSIISDSSAMELLQSNFILHVIILYLFFNLIIILFFDLVIKRN